jgi:hypothetical protein
VYFFFFLRPYSDTHLTEWKALSTARDSKLQGRRWKITRSQLEMASTSS